MECFNLRGNCYSIHRRFKEINHAPSTVPVSWPCPPLSSPIVPSPLHHLRPTRSDELVSQGFYSFGAQAPQGEAKLSLVPRLVCGQPPRPGLIVVCTGADKGMVRSFVQEDTLLSTCDQHESCFLCLRKTSRWGQDFFNRDTVVASFTVCFMLHSSQGHVYCRPRVTKSGSK